jgi:hypothetical protein
MHGQKRARRGIMMDATWMEKATITKSALTKKRSTQQSWISRSRRDKGRRKSDEDGCQQWEEENDI